MSGFEQLKTNSKSCKVRSNLVCNSKFPLMFWYLWKKYENDAQNKKICCKKVFPLPPPPRTLLQSFPAAPPPQENQATGTPATLHSARTENIFSEEWILSVLGDNSQKCHMDNWRTNESLYMVIYGVSRLYLSSFVLLLELWADNLFAIVTRIMLILFFKGVKDSSLWHQKRFTNFDNESFPMKKLCWFTL